MLKYLLVFIFFFYISERYFLSAFGNGLNCELPPVLKSAKA
ncbi:hypothetical protein D515_02205 [Grimontia indica]|uniref:Uncharacterized protein n=1 Tax=Grimontia indica TaxID=1056512 RepID=R1IE27_9GAMM|nr:hypothetical protein D515_02205 [Grimontia indica]